METILFEMYHNKKKMKRIRKLSKGKIFLIVICAIIAILLIIFSIINIFFKAGKLNKPNLVLILIEAFIFLVICEIEDRKRIKKYDEVIRDLDDRYIFLKEFLGERGYITKNQLKLLYIRLKKLYEKQEQELQNVKNSISNFFKLIIIPVFITILTQIIKTENIVIIVSYLIGALSIIIFSYMMSWVAIDIFKTTKVEKWYYMVSDMENMLDRCFPVDESDFR